MAAIWSHLADYAEATANKYICDIQAAFAPLLDFPDMGAPRFHILPGLRVLFHGDYGLYYLSSDETIEIVRILHMAQDVLESLVLSDV